MFKLTFLVIALAATAQCLPMWDSRIVGGVQVHIEDFPYQISMQKYGSHICGGSIIAGNLILTAAHCTDGQSASSLSIRVGSTYHANGGQVIRVQSIIQHPGFSLRHMDNDVAILVLSENITNNVARGIRLADTQPRAGDISTVTGWGYLREGGPIPADLRGVNLPIINHNDCVNAYYPASISARMLCAGYLGQGGKDACQGDSGGPLVANGVLAGVVSWGYGCADPNYPGVFADVAELRDWIRQNSGV